jgi:hypothetical protein
VSLKVEEERIDGRLSRGKEIQDSKDASMEAMLEQQGITNQDASD